MQARYLDSGTGMALALAAMGLQSGNLFEPASLSLAFAWELSASMASDWEPPASMASVSASQQTEPH